MGTNQNMARVKVYPDLEPPAPAEQVEPTVASATVRPGQEVGLCHGAFCIWLLC